MIKIAVATLVAASTATGPQKGCFGLDLTPDVPAKAQVEIKADSTLDFSVVISDPLPFALSEVCRNEKFAFDPMTSTLIVGQELSPCLAALMNTVNAVVPVMTAPFVIKFDSQANTLSMNIVIDLIMNKWETCRNLVEPVTTTAGPDGTSAAATTAGPASRYGSPGNGAGAFGAVTAILLGAIMAALM